jgi:hypothetical protein
MKNKKYTLDDLQEEDVKLILESLLFSSSVDVCSYWGKDEMFKIIDLALKIRKKYPSVITENVVLHGYGENCFFDQHSNQLPTYFPDLSKELI